MLLSCYFSWTVLIQTGKCFSGTISLPAHPRGPHLRSATRKAPRSESTRGPGPRCVKAATECTDPIFLSIVSYSILKTHAP